MDLEDKGQFSILDYIFFVIVLIISSCIGLYYAIKSRKTAISTEEYLLGGRKVGLFPICCSIVATTLTGVSTVGLSTETYAYGSYNLMGWYNMVVVGIITSWIILPVFAELKLTSTFKYLELRFNRRVRILASALFLLSGLIYLPFVLYVPSLIFQQVTGLDIYVTVTALSLICAVYTAIGGFKAVIWTDVVQMILLIGSFITILAVGIYSAGGLAAVFAAGSRGGRFQVVNTSNHNSRSSAWGWLFSTVLIFIYQLGLSQTSMQRFMSLTNLRDMRTSLFVILLTLIIFTALPIFLGVIVYANYETCDPFAAGIIRKIDQILPYFIQDKASLFLGFNGIFIAGIFSAGLSTTSSLC